MKTKNILWATMMLLFVFTACQDNKKKDNMDGDMELTDPNMSREEMEADGMDMNEVEETTTVTDIAMGSDRHTTLVSAIQGTNMAATLKSEGPYTVFAPTNEAFNALPDGTIENWMKPENSEKLEDVLSYHIVPGNVDSSKLRNLIEQNENNQYMLVTANNGELTATINDAGNIILTDGAGKKATVVSADMNASNGVVHSIDAVLMRK